MTVWLVGYFSLMGTALAAPASVAFWYAEKPPIPELSQFDWVVLEPGHASAADVHSLRQAGAEPFAYLSIGEFAGDAAALKQAGLSAAASPVANKAWGSQVMDLASPVWRRHLLERAAELAKAGYTGLFLDTLDSFQLVAKDQQETQRLALKSLLAELHRSQPSLKLFFNRGFEVQPELPGVAAAMAVESIYAGWDAGKKSYRPVSEQDREWLKPRIEAARSAGIPVIAIEYLPPARREEAKRLVKRLREEGYVPYITTPDLNTLGISSVELQPRRLALLYDGREGALRQSAVHRFLGSVLEYQGYRLDYFDAAKPLPEAWPSALYAGVVVWMTSGPPPNARSFNDWLGQRLDEKTPLLILGGLPLDNDALLKRLGLGISRKPLPENLTLKVLDPALAGSFEAPAKLRTRGLPGVQVLPGGPTPVVSLAGPSESYTPVGVASWGGFAFSPYLMEDGPEASRWIVEPFAFTAKTLRLPPLPVPDPTTENGRRIATVHIDGDAFVSKAEVPGAPYAGQMVLEHFIQPNPFLTSVSIIEGEVGPKGRYPELTAQLEPIARRLFADPKVEVATHTFSHPFFWQPAVSEQSENFEAQYGYMMQIPGYDKVDYTREVVGSTRYINERLTTARKPVKLIFWSGDAQPDAATLKLAYDNNLLNVNGGNSHITRSQPSVSGLYPFIRPTPGGLQYYAPIINENVYTNLWRGPYYGFRDLIYTFDRTENPRRLRGLNLYYHFYSATKQASLKVMDEIYRSMAAERPLSLWMSDYLKRLHGFYTASLARADDGSWSIKALDGLRTLRLDPRLGWPDLQRSQGIAGVRDLPQGRYVHLADDHVRLVLRDSRDGSPALEEANIPLQRWEYLSPTRIRFAFAGQFPLEMTVRAASACEVRVGRDRYKGQAGQAGLWTFKLPLTRVSDGEIVCG
ncbi:PbsX family transcriptional regulator [Pseudomonas oryzihabitans]|nr:PbsX family transcriptional regulator [Pseudomonas psychrotolerans]